MRRQIAKKEMIPDEKGPQEAAGCLTFPFLNTLPHVSACHLPSAWMF